MKLIVQIPCYNEAETLPEVVAAIPRAIPGVSQVEILVIDDGSTDDTSGVALRLGVEHVIRVPGNRGLAHAFQTGLDACLERGADIIVNTDGDHQYPGDQIPILIQPILDGRADIVIGDRRPRAGTQYSLAKKLLHRVGSAVVSFAAGQRILDPVSGFRALSREAARRLNILTQFSYTTEMVIQAARKRLRLAQVPVTTNPKTRPSRLFRSVFQFVGRSGGTILQTYAMYKPLQVFTLLGALPVLIGGGAILRFLWFAWSGQAEGKIQSLTIGAGLFVGGITIVTFGIVADLLARQRVLLERMMDRLLKLEELRLQERPALPPAPGSDPSGVPVEAGTEPRP